MHSSGRSSFPALFHYGLLEFGLQTCLCGFVARRGRFHLGLTIAADQMDGRLSPGIGAAIRASDLCFAGYSLLMEIASGFIFAGSVLIKGDWVRRGQKRGAGHSKAPTFLNVMPRLGKLFEMSG